MKKTTRNVFDSVCGLAAVISIALLCCKSCDNQDCVEKEAVIESRLVELQDSLANVSGRVQENREGIVVLQDSLANVSGRVQENRDSIVVLQDSLKNVSARLTDCEKAKRCPCKKKPVKNPVVVVVNPDTVVVEPVPVVVKPDTVVAKPQVVIQDNANHNVVNINNGTVNNYYSEPDTAKCRIVVRAKITQTIKTR